MAAGSTRAQNHFRVQPQILNESDPVAIDRVLPGNCGAFAAERRTDEQDDR
jgi:hypothetical protein